MAPSSKPGGPFELETIVRLLLLFNNTVALAVSFPAMTVLFIVIGSIFAVSILFNLFVLLYKARPRRLRLKNDDNANPCPSLIILAIDGLGVLVFLSLYVCSTVETATYSLGGHSGWRYRGTVLMTYSSIGTLVAFAMHAYLAIRNLHRYIKFRQSLQSRCPHCNQELGVAVAEVALPPSPIEGGQAPASPRQSFSANSVGENEGDMLIMKA